MENIFLVLLLVLVNFTCAQKQFKMCAPKTITDSECNALQRSGNTSQVSCIRVNDSAECAMKLIEGKVDFGFFNPEEMLLASQFFLNELQLIGLLTQPNRNDEGVDSQSMVIVPSSFNVTNGLAGLKHGGFCHPGFSEFQTRNDLILKNFEKKVYEAQCRDDLTVSENEAENLKNFYGKACRPGKWVLDSFEDRILKSKYPELCALCDDKSACKYNDDSHHGHFGAIDCLVSGRGQVAYVNYEYVSEYFKLDTAWSSPPFGYYSFRFLCMDGTTDHLGSMEPCAWVKRLGIAILARNNQESWPLFQELDDWLLTAKVPNGMFTLKSIIDKMNVTYFSVYWTLRGYLALIGAVKLPKNTCLRNIRWCTIGESETNKCKWLAQAALVLAIEPRIACEIANSTSDCLRNIADDKADIIVIDSKNRYLARRIFNLTTLMYGLSHNERNSKVIAVVRENSPIKISSFKDLKNRTVCFSKYGGISWSSFLDTFCRTNIISDYPESLSEFFSAVCIPAIKVSNHSNDTIRCNVDGTFSAIKNNNYGRNIGAMKCLNRGTGDIAFVKAQTLKDRIIRKTINPDEYRVLCKNGSLSTYRGFNVDKHCAFSLTIDSEVVSRKNNSKIFVKDLIGTLSKLDRSLGYLSRRVSPIRIYGSFNGTSNLLFKDSTIGLVSPSSEWKSASACKITG